MAVPLSSFFKALMGEVLLIAMIQVLMIRNSIPTHPSLDVILPGAVMILLFAAIAVHRRVGEEIE